MRLIQIFRRWITDLARRTAWPEPERTDLECMRMCVAAVDGADAADHDRRKYAA